MENAPPTHPLAVQAVPLESIHLDPANVRTHPDRNLASIRESLTRFGQQKPIVVDRHGTIRAGNGTYLAARELGWATIQVVVSELEGLEAAAYSVADNRTTDLSEFEPESLAKLLAELRQEDALDGVGFDAAEIDEMLAELAGEVETDVEDPGAEDPPLHPTSRAGDLWILGAHRLLCGDSTKPEDVRRVMGDEHVMSAKSDEPTMRDLGILARRFAPLEHQASGEHDDELDLQLWYPALQLALDHFFPGDISFTWRPAAHEDAEEALEGYWRRVACLPKKTLERMVSWVQLRRETMPFDSSLDDLTEGPSDPEVTS